jgi:DUF971 family protein
MGPGGSAASTVGGQRCIAAAVRPSIVEPDRTLSSSARAPATTRTPTSTSAQLRLVSPKPKNSTASACPVQEPMRAACTRGRRANRAALAPAARARNDPSMSIWDHMRPAAKLPAPQSIALDPDGALRIRWDDGRATLLAAREMRIGCPCAECVDEMTGERRLDPSTIAADVGIQHLEPVGNYALRAVFSDGHDTGLFNFQLLRSISR